MYRAREVPVAQVDQREIESTKVPLWHNLDQSSAAQQVGVDQRRKVANAGTSHQCVREPGVVVHREVRLKGQSFPVLPFETPTIPWLPVEEQDQPMTEQILRSLPAYACRDMRGSPRIDVDR